jgi:L-threonylcarbamoyladenylate synthase
MPVLPASPQTWKLARLVVAGGGLVAFPTDTVYGVGCDPYNLNAIEKLYGAKGREREKALPLLLAGVEECARVAGDLPEPARRLGSTYWPGALTLVVPRAPGLPVELGGGNTIAVRVPAHDKLRAFIGACGGALASSSANLSGRPDARTAQQVMQYFADNVDLIVDGGETPGGVPSTVVNCVTDPPRVLREGAIARHQIERTLLEQL